MKTEITALKEIFNTPKTITTNGGTVYFVGADVCKALGYAKPRDAIKNHCIEVVEYKEIKGDAPQNTAQGIRGTQLMLTKHDVRRLVMKSKMPQAQEYEKMIHLILDEVEATGSYIDPTKRTEAQEKLWSMKATRHSIDEQRNYLVSVIWKVLEKENITEQAAKAMVANITDAIYQIGLLKTASHIKYEQIMAGGALKLVTTNQLRTVESARNIDFERALNYMNDDELEEVKAVFDDLIPAIAGIGKRKFAKATTARVKDKLREHLLSMWNDIPEETKEQYSDTLVHHKGIVGLMKEINSREGKGITKEDQDKAQSLPTKKAPFMN